MLHERLERYLAEVELALETLADIYVERYEEEIITSERVNLRIRIRSVSGHLLELNEALIIKNSLPVHLDYRYHCQDAQNRLLFRYDSTPHFPDLPNFPHHKHVADSVIGVKKPSIINAIWEANALNT